MSKKNIMPEVVVDLFQVATEKDPEMVTLNIETIWESLRGKKESEPWFLTERFKGLNDTYKLLMLALTNYWKRTKSLMSKSLFYDVLRIYLGRKGVYDKAKLLRNKKLIAIVDDQYVAFNFAPSDWTPPYEYKETWKKFNTRLKDLLGHIDKYPGQSYPIIKKEMSRRSNLSTMTIRNNILFLVSKGYLVPTFKGLGLSRKGKKVIK